MVTPPPHGPQPGTGQAPRPGPARVPVLLPLLPTHPLPGLVPRDTLAGTAAWLIQKETQDMATSKTEGM